MAEFWLISVPLDKVSSQSLEKLKRAIVKASLGSYFRFHIPELKVRRSGEMQHDQTWAGQGM